MFIIGSPRNHYIAFTMELISKASLKTTCVFKCILKYIYKGTIKKKIIIIIINTITHR